jgi:glutathione S-transferase
VTQLNPVSYGRYALNFKGIPFTTYWLETKDVQTVAPLIGGVTTVKLPNGVEMYTVPIIYDPSTKKVITDSLPIAEYLDTTYPSLPPLIPRGTKGLIRAFDHALKKELRIMAPFIIPQTINILPDVSKPYFRATREGFFGKKLEEIPPKGEEREREWGKVKEMFNVFAGCYDHEEGEGTRNWIMGENASYPEFIISAALVWIMEILGEDSVEWKDIKEWNGGRWAKLRDSCSAFEGEY